MVRENETLRVALTQKYAEVKIKITLLAQRELKFSLNCEQR